MNKNQKYSFAAGVVFYCILAMAGIIFILALMGVLERKKESHIVIDRETVSRSVREPISE